jgi:signal peptidase I
MTKPNTEPKRRWHQNYWLQLAVLLLCVAAFRSSLFNHYLVPSGSMEPTLLPGDYVAVNMTAYGLSVPFTRKDLIATGEPSRGDIVVFRSPQNGIRLIKRVVAVGGDVVSLKEGHLSLNGNPVAVSENGDMEQLETARFSLNLNHAGGPDIQSLVVPQGKVLLLGDHRGASADSRYFGLVDVDALYGRAVATYHRRGGWLEWTPLHQ